MVRTFRGEFTQKVDGKGRVNIPADFRREIELGDPDWAAGHPATFVLNYGDDHPEHLQVYTLGAAREIEQLILRMPRDEERELLEIVFGRQALTMTVDATGRIVLPMSLRERVEIDEAAYFAASGDSFGIWKPETYEARHGSKVRDLLSARPTNFKALSLLDKYRIPGAAG